MGKRPLNPAVTNEANKRHCTRPSTLASNSDSRKSGAFGPPKKSTVPQPFNLSSRSAFREQQLEKYREAEERRRRQLETFKPSINAKRPACQLPVAPPKKQSRQLLPKKDSTKEGPSKEGVSTASSVLAAPRVPLGAITNTDMAKSSPKTSPKKHGKAAHPPVPPGRLGLQPRVSIKCNPLVTVTGPPSCNTRALTARGCMGPPPSLNLDQRPATARCPLLSPKRGTAVPRRLSHAGVTPSTEQLRHAPAPAVTAGRWSTCASSLNHTVPGRVQTRRATAGPTQHAPPLSAKEPRQSMFAVASLRKSASFKTVTFESPHGPRTPRRSTSAPTGERSASVCTGLSDADVEQSPKEYGPEGYCRIVKEDTFCDGRYTALSKLGEGKYSTVWLMYDRDGPYEEFSNFVAIKVGRAMSSDVFPEDIKRESNLLEYINTTHSGPNLRCLATLIGSFIHKGPHGLHACMVFKVLGSQLLRLVYERNEACRSGLPLDVSGVIKIFKCVLQGTAGFHAHNIVHTDLKPENILLSVPDKEVVDQMRTFAKEHNLPEPYLDQRPRASITPHRPAAMAMPVMSPGQSAPKRSNSVDPLNFWRPKSPPTALDEADQQATEEFMGRSTMACVRPLPEEPAQMMEDMPCKPVDPPKETVALDDIMTDNLGPPAPTAEDTSSPADCSPAGSNRRSFICAHRGSAVRLFDSPELGAAIESPPPKLALRHTPAMDSPPPKFRPLNADETAPKTPVAETCRVNPSTPQYVLDQGKGTDVLIGDFGLAMVLEHGHALAPPGVHIYPQDCVVMNHSHGMVIQTREYRAPEVLLGQDFNVKIDVYSIACIMVELITGEYLWDPKNTVPRRLCHAEHEIDREHLQHMVAVMGAVDLPKLRSRRTCFKTRFFLPNGELRIPPPRRRKANSRPLREILAPHVPEPTRSELAHLLNKMLAFHPTDRWSAQQCLDFLEQPAFAAPSQGD